MPGNTTKIFIEVQVDGKGGIKVLRQIGTESEKTGKKGKKAFDTMGKSAGFLSGKLTGVVGAIGGIFAISKMKSMVFEWTRLAGVQEKAEAGMLQAMRSMGRYTPELHATLIQTAKDIQALTTYGDEAIIAGQKFLLTYKQIPDELLVRTTKAMVDLAALMGGDTARAANTLGKAAMGLTGELRRVGITIDDDVAKSGDFAKILAQIEQQVRGQAEALARTGIGPWEQLNNIWGDSKEQLGEVILALTTGLHPRLKELAERVGVVAEEWRKWAEQNDALIKQKTDQYIGKTRDVLQEIWDLISSHPDIIHFGLIGLALYGRTGLLLGVGLSHASEIYKTYAEIIKLAVAGRVSIQQSLAAVGALATQDVTKLRNILKEIKGLSGATGSWESKGATGSWELYKPTPIPSAPPAQSLFPLMPTPPPDITLITERANQQDRLFEALERSNSLQLEAIEKNKEWAKSTSVATAISAAEWEEFWRKQAGWVQGATLALDEYAKAATDKFENARWAFQNIMWSMEDALVNMVRTGKLEFSDLADHIIAEMARATIRQYITGPFAGWLSDSTLEIATPLPPASFQYGGWINEPVVGRGRRSGRIYTIAEKEPELVTPGRNIRKGGGGVSVQVNVINESGIPLSAEAGDVRFDGERYVADVHIDRLINNRSYRQANRQAFRGM